jgi:ribonucleoside-diphosphate reductase alpha subunit
MNIVRELIQKTPFLCGIEENDISNISLALSSSQTPQTPQTTSKITQIGSFECMNLVWKHPHYSILAARFLIHELHERFRENFQNDPVRVLMYLNDDQQINSEIVDSAIKHRQTILDFVDFTRDYTFDYFGISTLINGGYFKTLPQNKIPLSDTNNNNNITVETPQILFLRVALAIHGDDIDSVRETYDSLSRKECIHATPTLFHSGTNHEQFSSCFLLQIEDSIDDMYRVAHKCALISKYGGGIGIALHKIRSSGSIINTSRGRSTGMIPYLKVLDSLAKHVDQGGKRPGSIAVYLEPWHPDIISFIRAKHPQTLTDERADHLNYAIWTNDLFMKRVQENGTWSFFCPGEFPELVDLVGSAFEERYIQFENEGSFKSQMPAQELWGILLKSQVETGMPYLLFKDACNLKSNQKNLGTIYSSNLCAEIVEHTSSEETAVCNLASVGLPSCVEGVSFNFEKLDRIVRMLVRNINKIIPKTFYTTECAKKSNLDHRPIGIGIQGYADVFALLGICWESKEAKELTERVSAHMYYSALDESCELARNNIGVYASFKGSPLSFGQFQFDLWNQTPYTNRFISQEINMEMVGNDGVTSVQTIRTSYVLDWELLREKIIKYGVANSLCIALMPTASTSNILGYNETFEPFTYNLYTRRTLAGEYVMINKYLVQDLMNRSLWDHDMYNELIQQNGSVQGIVRIPSDLKERYKTVRELKKVPLLELAAIRGKYVCQTQSMNLYISGKTSDIQLLHNSHMKSWKLGLKTAVYYTHSQPASLGECTNCSA